MPQSWTLFTLLGLSLAAFLSPFMMRYFSFCPKPLASYRVVNRIKVFLAFSLLGVCWLVAWTRLPGMGELQYHTFTPLWVSYILAANILLRDRIGTAPLFHERSSYLMLFPVSALLWWCFEFLNRFTENWSYENISHFSPSTYILFATAAYCTVLPAIEITKRLLKAFISFAAFQRWKSFAPTSAQWNVLGAFAMLSLGLIPLFPWELFPFVWVAPPLVLGWFARRAGFKTLLDDLSEGDWTEVVAYALAALVCGILWETWNYWSLAQWRYAVPYVGQYKIFAMPLLGYAGYLPFGVMCGMVINLLVPAAPRHKTSRVSASDEHIAVLL